MTWLSRGRPDLLRELAPRVLPFGWTGPIEMPSLSPYGLPEINAHRYHRDGLTVIVGVEEHRDEEGNAAGVWLHVSLSRPHRLPSWDDVARVKRVFVGDELCVQVLPPKRQYVNVHPHCLHLWRRIDAPTVPEALVENVYQHEVNDG